MNDEEAAFKIVRLYFEEVARLGFKRSLDLDQMINAYFYTLNRLKHRDKAMKEITQRIINESKNTNVEGTQKTTTVEETVSTKTTPAPIVTSTTVTTVNSAKPNSSVVEKIVEES
ncbi:MAG: hypothetical protein NTY48_00985 [Candidatus Diapherotrites archaeon]|nr:hypothetical protein [Candidatus Diapherotrites archaeon]